jgi:hypothetical protein
MYPGPDSTNTVKNMRVEAAAIFPAALAYWKMGDPFSARVKLRVDTLVFDHPANEFPTVYFIAGQ